jgi:hypothetical protein
LLLEEVLGKAIYEKVSPSAAYPIPYWAYYQKATDEDVAEILAAAGED